ncbi:MAG: hypothetical protein R3C32_01435 [Chloroflexota bacterium]
MGRVIDDMFVRHGELRQGLDPRLALDLLFGLHRAETYLAFTAECGWTMERYKAWQFATLARALLPPADVTASVSPDSVNVADLSFGTSSASFADGPSLPPTIELRDAA